MSGIEVVGLVLGAFPLVISAMEHYEDVKKVSTTWWRIKRAHKKDLGRVKDCHLKFKLNLKELLLPLVLDGVVNKGEYESLLASPGGDGWREEHVENALEERLAECHMRYVEILGELIETMGRLSKECRVDDADFQEALRRKGERTTSATPNQQAQTDLMIKANIAFEAKRVKYSFSGGRREDLLAEIEGYNTRLQDVLASNDRISALSQHSKVSAPRKTSNKSLNFWKHAASIFRILDSLWNCNCRSKAQLWLQHRTFSEVNMKMKLHLCHGQQPMHVTDVPPTLRIPSGTGSTTRSTSSVAIHSTSATGKLSTMSSASSTVTLVSRSVSATACAARMPLSDIQADGICKSCSAVHGSHQSGLCLGTVSEGDHDYAIFPAVEPVTMADSATLAEMLQPQFAGKLTRVQRYGIALTLASSHLQLYSTPWLKEYWTAEDVCFPTYAGNAKALHGEPYILTYFDSCPANGNVVKKDRSFSTLGIVLLELCFGSRLEEHHLWSNPAFAAGKNDPMIRQAVACEWLEDVQGEAGEDYATAVNWTLRQAPIVVKDDRWRADFANSVVQPLQRYYEYLNPKLSNP
ncbi:hypothetical protein M409DRAFT_26168 [Zasmidium cellare ATCC 36951]|uniref:DUF7580 domain-containing protein n=1 Tax=Zasmidium cellare ATCC 36951 TaxID=1080233 RepID=A0A6A6CDQ0_ZASCE|nr:uncharacterized protein M409DRAFT_26168 [Zasmidium cellare ATCC 36951]KAF2163556.1 hypothetical protein M409DRAFT_26168 [Zasmidium cellare ATCC 36951]